MFSSAIRNQLIRKAFVRQADQLLQRNALQALTARSFTSTTQSRQPYTHKVNYFETCGMWYEAMIKTLHEFNYTFRLPSLFLSKWKIPIVHFHNILSNIGDNIPPWFKVRNKSKTQIYRCNRLFVITSSWWIQYIWNDRWIWCLLQSWNWYIGYHRS